MTLSHALRSLRQRAGRALIALVDIGLGDVMAPVVNEHGWDIWTGDDPSFVPTAQRWRMPDGSLKGIPHAERHGVAITLPDEFVARGNRWQVAHPVESCPDRATSSEAAPVGVRRSPLACPACDAPLVISMSVSTRPVAYKVCAGTTAACVPGPDGCGCGSSR